MADRLVIAKAPVRIADLGGWTDTWFAGHGVVCSVAVQPGVEVRLSAREVAGRGEVVVDAVNLGGRYSLTTGRGRHPLLEAAIDEVGTDDGLDIEIRVDSAMPPGASTGTSAAVTVALVGALQFLRTDGVPPDPTSVASTAHAVESDRLGRQCGIQDQLAAAHGGVNLIEMTAYPGATVTPLSLSSSTSEDLERRLVLVLFGRGHVSTAVHEEVIASLEGSTRAEVDARLEPMRAAARSGADALQAGDLEAYGTALVANTSAQAALHGSLVGADAVRLFSLAAEVGAAGWKVNGAGGDGGSATVLCAAAPGARQRLADAVKGLGGGSAALDTVLDHHGLQVRWSEGLD